MSAPGVTITRQDTPPPRSADTDTGKLFIAGLALRGPIDTAVEVTSLTQLVATYGIRDTGSTLYDELDLFFHEGGARAIVARYAGPGAAKATRNLLDGSAGVALIVTAKGVGSYGNSITVQVTHPDGTHYQLIVVGTDGAGNAVTETSGSYTTTAEAVAWATTTSTLVNITQGASTLIPAVLAASVLGNTTSGTDDRASVTDTQRTTALNLFTSDFGPGQVKVAGATATATHQIVEAHAETYGRIPANDGPDTATVATITAVAATDRAATGARNAGMFVPWPTIPALTVGGTVRTVPPGAFYAALAARNDGRGITPNQAAAGDLGRSNGYVTGLSQIPWNDTDRATLSAAGVTVLREVAGAVEVYDDVTLANPTTDPNWAFLSNARFFTAIRAQALDILEGYMFRQIDGRGHLLGEVAGALTGMLMPYFTAGSLYGDSPADAFNVDMSDNTDESIANGDLTASLALRMSPPAKNIELAIIKVSVAGSVA